MHTVQFGDEGRGRVAIEIHGYEHVASGDYWDDNWLSVEVSVAAGAFRGKYPASFAAGDLESLYGQLKALLESLAGQAEFKTIEEQLSLVFVGDGLGHIQIKGKAVDEAGIGNRLTFDFVIDQTQLQSSVRSLGAMIASFPVRT